MKLNREQQLLFCAHTGIYKALYTIRRLLLYLGFPTLGQKMHTQGILLETWHFEFS